MWWHPASEGTIVEVLDPTDLSIVSSFRWQSLNTSAVVRPIPSSDDVLVASGGIWRLDMGT